MNSDFFTELRSVRLFSLKFNNKYENTVKYIYISMKILFKYTFKTQETYRKYIPLYSLYIKS